MGDIIVVVACIALNALLAAYEMAFVSVSKADLKSLAKSSPQGKKILELRAAPERTLSIIQIGITLVGAIAAAVGGAGASDTLEPYLTQQFGLRPLSAEVIAVTTFVIPLTFLNVIVGELVPKSLALRNPKKIVLAGAPFLFYADQALSPVVTLLESSTQFLLKIFFPKQAVDTAPDNTLIEIDSFTPIHQKYMMNLADLERKTAKDILVPWSSVNLVTEDQSVEEITQIVLSSGHTRLPVLQNNKIGGVLHTKEFMSLKESGERHWESIIRPLLRVKSTDSILGLLRLLQEKRSHMCVVFTPVGELLGILTLEDIIEEVVGDIYDEDDDGRIRKVFISRSKDRSRRT